MLLIEDMNLFVKHSICLLINSWNHNRLECTSHSYWVSNCVSIATSSSIVVYYNLLQRYLISMMYIMQALSLVIFPMMIEARNPSPGWFHTWYDVKRCHRLPRFAFPLLILQISELRTQRILIVRQAHTVPPLSYMILLYIYYIWCPLYHITPLIWQ